MRRESERVDFFFHDEVVGYFGSGVPGPSGRHGYVPYRGLGHLRLVQALALGAQVCHYLGDGEKHYFTVLSATENTLEILEA